MTKPDAAVSDDLRTASPASEEALLRIHPADYLARSQALSDAGGKLGDFAPIGPGSYETAGLHEAGPGALRTGTDPRRLRLRRQRPRTTGADAADQRSLSGDDPYAARGRRAALRRTPSDDPRGRLLEAYVPFCGHAVVEELSGVRTEVADTLLDFLRQQQPNAELQAFQREQLDRLAASWR